MAATRSIDSSCKRLDVHWAFKPLKKNAAHAAGIENEGRNRAVLFSFFNLSPSTKIIGENENGIVLENNFFKLRVGLVASHALPGKKHPAGGRAAARRDGWQLVAHEGCGQSAGCE
jgi:hypothetical protein